MSKTNSQKPKRKRMRAKFRLTREGKFFVGVTIGVGFAAVNTGNNLLYLVLGLMLSLMLFSGVLSDLSMWYLTVKRRFPKRMFVNQQGWVQTNVFNRKQRIPSFSLELYHPEAGVDSTQLPVEASFFLRVGARHNATEQLSFTPTRRGEHKAPRLRLRTQYPFGLIEKSREIHDDVSIVVYPEIDRSEIDPTQADVPGVDTSPWTGSGDEIAHLREWQDGDDGRRIHWRKSAAWDRLVVKQMHRNAGKSISLILHGLPPTLPESERPAWLSSAEKTISQLAGQALAAHDSGNTVEVVAGAERKSVGPDESMDRIWHLLAVHSVDTPLSATPSFSDVREFVIPTPASSEATPAPVKRWWSFRRAS